MTPLLFSAGFLFFAFWLTWRLSVRHDNFSFVDVAWALSFAPVAMVHAFLSNGWGPRRFAIAALLSLWSLRLGFYLWRRVAVHHPAEDPRYAVLRDRWAENLQRNFFGFFQAQGLLVWLLMLPVWMICRHSSPAFHPLEFSGLALWIVALAGEALADRQLSLFKKRNIDPLAVCEVGLWRFSRHPNYFFQSLLWWALFLMALPAPWGWSTVLAPLTMLVFLLRFTGIPLTEELALKKRGDAYRQYQKSTSAFLPLPRKIKTRSR